jgi:hypothetical protein
MCQIWLHPEHLVPPTPPSVDLHTQERYSLIVEQLSSEARRTLQAACIHIHSDPALMSAVLAANEVNEWGSTLLQVTSNALVNGWSVARVAGVPYNLARPTYCYLS